MTGRAWYNEIDGHAADTLESLIRMGCIAPGVVDRRDIRDVQPDDLDGFDQCHFFAGIGAWSYALRLGGIPDSRRLWTASCPCQPFSQAGRGLGFADERHLWPSLFHLIQKRRPERIYGEQVAGKAGRAWLDLVCDDLEADSYAIGADDLPSCSVGAPHIRQRLHWVADANKHVQSARRESGSPERQMLGGRGALIVGLATGEGRQRCADGGRPLHAQREAAERTGGDAGAIVVGQPDSGGWAAREQCGASVGQGDPAFTAGRNGGPGSAYWDDLHWIPCRDGKSRPAKPSIFPLVDGVAGGAVALGRAVQGTTQEEGEHWFSRVAVLRGAGNCINPILAVEFILAAEEALSCL